MPLRKLCSCLLGAALATCVLTTGCQPQSNSGQTSAQPAPNETVIYNKWEVATNRPHKDLAQRPQAEQKEYQDWRQKNPNVH